ncbi:hypothetical protein Pla123a_16310 [Posidoniimonas polymericola]|uniref:VWFA domain-containing protein n=1 Tax=Posidoniimonas polymericola TaxID=2528002 RepID=A0A5C5YSB4_9BACT|nr:hypothetical protein [Posidoniimonas polymericola]TWT77835.1 hypothetical protein Pla123a_16310 [Posidoniimonas polymericola]
MANRNNLGGIVHTYQRYDPKRFPSPTQPPPDLVSGAMEHMLAYGEYRELTEEELARAVRIDPSQIQGLGPSLDHLIAMLEERKRKILERYETRKAQKKAGKAFRQAASQADPPKQLRESLGKAVRQEQLRDLERLWYRAGDDQSPFARQLVHLIAALGDKYEVDELAAKYAFTGRESMTVPQAIEIKEELEKIDELLEQLREAAENAQIGVIDMEALAEFAEPGDVSNLSALQQQVQDYLREMAEQQGLQQTADGYQLTPKAQRLFQGKLLQKLFSELTASRTGRHDGPIVGEGSVEMQRTRQYEYGDSVANLDITTSLTNAILREGPGLPIRLKQDDLEVHYTRNTPKAATCVIMDMSGSMRYDGQYMNVKRMALALDGLIRSEYPGDFLQFIEMYSFAKPCRMGEIVKLMPKPVTVHDPWVRLRADMSDPDISESMVPPHFTNIQHSLATARRFLAAQDTPNRQIVLITDGLPTAHFEGSELFLLYPPDPQTEQATMREGQLCKQEGITINMFLVPSWSQSEEDIRFAYRLAETTTGRVFFTAGRDLDRYVVWDYVKRRRDIVS